MDVTLSTLAMEQGTYIITAAFTDEDDAAVIPNSITWSLYDDQNNIINNREDVSVDTPAASIDIVLSGDDLSISSLERIVIHRLTISGTYDSDAGNNLPFNDEVFFKIKNMRHVS